MTTASSTSAGPSAPAGFSVSAGSSASAGPSVLAGSSASAGLWAPVNVPATAGLVPSPNTGLPVVQDMAKPFFIGKPVTTLDNTTA